MKLQSLQIVHCRVPNAVCNNIGRNTILRYGAVHIINLEVSIETEVTCDRL